MQQKKLKLGLHSRRWCWCHLRNWF